MDAILISSNEWLVFNVKLKDGIYTADYAENLSQDHYSNSEHVNEYGNFNVKGSSCNWSTEFVIDFIPIKDS